MGIFDKKISNKKFVALLGGGIALAAIMSKKAIAKMIYDPTNNLLEVTNAYISNNLGVRTNNPQAPAHILSTSAQLRLDYNGSSYITLQGGSSHNLIINSSNATNAQFRLANDTSTARGIGSFEWQPYAGSTYYAAQGNYSLVMGRQNRAISEHNVCIGRSCQSSGLYGTIIGSYQSQIGGNYSVLIGGRQNAAAGDDYMVCVGGYLLSVGGEYSVGVGGYNNNITGSSCAIIGGSENSTGSDSQIIMGGYDNLTIGGNYVSIIGSYQSEARGGYSAVLAGREHLIQSGKNYTAIIAGYLNTIKASNSVCVGGYGNETNEEYTIVSGKEGNARIYGANTMGGGKFSTLGDCQVSRFICRGVTTDDTETEIYPDANSDNQIIIPNNTAWMVKLSVMARATDGDVAWWKVEGAVDNSSFVSSLAFTTLRYSQEDDGIAWDANIKVDDATDRLQVMVKGNTDKTIYWTVYVKLVEVTTPAGAGS